MTWAGRARALVLGDDAIAGPASVRATMPDLRRGVRALLMTGAESVDRWVRWRPDDPAGVPSGALWHDARGRIVILFHEPQRRSKVPRQPSAAGRVLLMPQSPVLLALRRAALGVLVAGALAGIAGAGAVVVSGAIPLAGTLLVTALLLALSGACAGGVVLMRRRSLWYQTGEDWRLLTRSYVFPGEPDKAGRRGQPRGWLETTLRGEAASSPATSPMEMGAELEMGHYPDLRAYIRAQGGAEPVPVRILAVLAGVLVGGLALMTLFSSGG